MPDICEQVRQNEAVKIDKDEIQRSLGSNADIQGNLLRGYNDNKVETLYTYTKILKKDIFELQQKLDRMQSQQTEVGE